MRDPSQGYRRPPDVSIVGSIGALIVVVGLVFGVSYPRIAAMGVVLVVGIVGAVRWVRRHGGTTGLSLPGFPRRLRIDIGSEEDAQWSLTVALVDQRGQGN